MDHKMASYTPNGHFTTRRNSSSSPYAINVRPRSNSTSASPYNIPNRANHGNHRFSFNGTSNIEQPGQSSAGNGNVPLLTREFVVRRISEGETGRLKQELKCEACGKGYKHISSLAKHLWEHTAEWNYTKKLLISKHQQVQLLEAASILVSMNENDKKKGSREQTPTSKDNNLFSPHERHESFSDGLTSPAKQHSLPKSEFLDNAVNGNHLSANFMRKKDVSDADERTDAENVAQIGEKLSSVEMGEPEKEEEAKFSENGKVAEEEKAHYDNKENFKAEMQKAD